MHTDDCIIPGMILFGFLMRGFCLSRNRSILDYCLHFAQHVLSMSISIILFSFEAGLVRLACVLDYNCSLPASFLVQIIIFLLSIQRCAGGRK